MSSIWKGTISFGLLNIPVSLQTANEDKDISFHMLDSKDMSPIKFRRVNEKTGREVPYDRIQKGYEYEKGKFVLIDDKDFKAANVKATQTLDIEDFVLLDEIDTMLFDKPYYMVPEKGGEKSYFLLRDALRKSGKVAVGKIVIRTKQHLGCVMPKGDYLVLELLRFAHEVIEVKEADYLAEKEIKKADYSPRELKMAQDLIHGMTADWEPDKYKDTYHDDLMKRIKAKIDAGEGKEVAEPDQPEEDLKPTKVVDLLPLLRQSLDAKKKGHAAPPPAKRAAKSRATSHRHAH